MGQGDQEKRQQRERTRSHEAVKVTGPGTIQREQNGAAWPCHATSSRRFNRKAACATEGSRCAASFKALQLKGKIAPGSILPCRCNWSRCECNRFLNCPKARGLYRVELIDFVG